MYTCSNSGVLFEFYITSKIHSYSNFINASMILALRQYWHACIFRHSWILIKILMLDRHVNAPEHNVWITFLSRGSNSWWSKKTRESPTMKNIKMFTFKSNNRIDLNFHEKTIYENIMHVHDCLKILSKFFEKLHSQ